MIERCALDSVAFGGVRHSVVERPRSAIQPARLRVAAYQWVQACTRPRFERSVSS